MQGVSQNMQGESSAPWSCCTPVLYYVLACVVVLVIVLVVLYGESESFTDRNDKANAIATWFANHLNPRFTDYRDDITPDIVEYSRMKQLCSVKSECLADNIKQAL